MSSEFGSDEMGTEWEGFGSESGSEEVITTAAPSTEVIQ